MTVWSDLTGQDAAIALLRGEPEQPGIWLLGGAAALVATVVATAALAVRSGEG